MPKRAARAPMPPLELEVMKVLWEIAPAPVQVVQARLSRERPLAYNTVQTVLGILHRKGRVRRQLVGRAYHYAPAVTRLQAARQAVGDLVARLFDGSPERLVMSLVETRQLTPEDLARLSELLEKGEETGDEKP
jgi:predicted transcriptional regulator